MESFSLHYSTSKWVFYSTNYEILQTILHVVIKLYSTYYSQDVLRTNTMNDVDVRRLVLSFNV